MASWLQNVGTFLEKLDDKAEEVVEEHQQHLLFSSQHHDDHKAEILEEVEVAGVESVLAARGLSSNFDDDTDDEDEVVFDDDAKKKGGVEESQQQQQAQQSPPPVEATSAAGGGRGADTPLLEDGWNEDFSAHTATEASEQAAETVKEEANQSQQQQQKSSGDVEILPGGIFSAQDSKTTTSSPKDDDEKQTPGGKDGDDASKQQKEVHDTPDPAAAPDESSTKEVSTSGKGESSPKEESSSSSSNSSELSESVVLVPESKQTSAPPPPPPTAAPQKAHQDSSSNSAAAILEAPKANPASTKAAPATSTTTAANAKATTTSSPSAATREAQKEARTLRRHVLSLNKQLETAEAEISAQRAELERAAERLEKDRVRFKEEREKEKQRHTAEQKAAQQQNEQAIASVKQRCDKQVQDLRTQLNSVEERRMQEGGDWNKEMADAVLREQEMARNYALLEDEKATLLSQIGTLQDQQEALGSRLESLSQTADNAMERERQAEDRLDEALSLHARQLSQRQSREAELERTVSELGSALVVARSKLAASSSSHPENGGISNNSNNEASSGSQVATLQQDLEVLTAQLTHEQQRCEALQNELRDISKERTEEASSSHSNQIHNDRKIAELSHTVARLEAELRDARQDVGGTRPGGGSFSSTGNKNGGGEDARQIKHLSEEVLRHREKLANCNSEISALKSRLHVANSRATKAEAALEESQNINGASSGDEWRDVELNAPPSSSGNNMMRRRGGGRAGNASKRTPSMRSALPLGPGQSTEKIGKALDGMDIFLVESGKFLRYNPLARLIFICYLLILHLWTFALFFFHAHGFETVHGDFGAGHGVPHGPHALMEQHPALQKAAGEAVAAASAPMANVTAAAVAPVAGQT